MWNARDGALMQVFAGHSASVSCGGFAPDGKSVATGSSDGSLRLWAPRTGECATLFMGHPFHDGPVTCLDFHPSTEGLIMTGSEDNTARLVSGVSGKVLGTLAAHAETLECVGLSGDFPFAASGAIDAKLVVWDLNTLQPRNTLTHDKAVSALRWIPGTACLYRCVRHDRNAVRSFSRSQTRRRFPAFLRSFPGGVFAAFLFFSRFAIRDATKGPRSAIRADAAVDNSLQDSTFHVGRSYGAPRRFVRA
jgi:WD40 repeat protein